jgi:hypothetical protein
MIIMSWIIDVITFVVELLIATGVFYALGRWLQDADAKLSDAFFIAFLGLIIQFGLDAVLTWYLTPYAAIIASDQLLRLSWMAVGWLATFTVWILLVQHFFDCLFKRGLTIVVISFVLIAIIDIAITYGLRFIFLGHF